MYIWYICIKIELSLLCKMSNWYFFYWYILFIVIFDRVKEWIEYKFVYNWMYCIVIIKVILMYFKKESKCYVKFGK